jgi:hypothetical protein
VRKGVVAREYWPVYELVGVRNPDADLVVTVSDELFSRYQANMREFESLQRAIDRLYEKAYSTQPTGGGLSLMASYGTLTVSVLRPDEVIVYKGPQ